VCGADRGVPRPAATIRFSDALTNRGLHWANLFVLFTTALLPFPTAVVPHALQEKNQPTSASPSPCTRWLARCCARVGWRSSTTSHGTAISSRRTSTTGSFPLNGYVRWLGLSCTRRPVSFAI
jgi:hypothetical protein